MSFLALALFAFSVDQSLAIPVDAGYLCAEATYDAVNSGCGGLWNLDYCRWGLGIRSLRGVFPFNKCASWLASDNLDWWNPNVVGPDEWSGCPGFLPDYLCIPRYPAYPKTVSFANENFFRGNAYGTTEFGTRDEVTIRPSYARPWYRNNIHSPFSRTSGDVWYRR